MKAKTHVKSEIAWQGGDMRVVMKHSVPGQKKKIELDLTAGNEGSVYETATLSEIHRVVV